MIDLVETLDRLIGVAKDLLTICEEQAKVIEQNELLSADYAIQRRGELESFRQILEKSIRGE